MTVLSYTRETPFTASLNSLLTALPLVIVGGFVLPKDPTTVDLIALWIWTAYSCCNGLNQFLLHSNLPWSYGWIGRWLTVSPANHRVHHSMLPEYYDKNFSVTLVLWDRLFGTYHEGIDASARACPLGYEGNIYNKSRWIVDEYFYPLRAFLDRARQDVARRLASSPPLRRATFGALTAVATAAAGAVILAGWVCLTGVDWLRRGLKASSVRPNDPVKI